MAMGAVSSPSGWTVSGETRYIYDGMRVIQERNSSNVPTVSYTRGQDLSGSLEGAGGIGGLLARSDQYSSGSMTRHACYFADGNGNVVNLVNAGAGHAVWATYRYSPFGVTTYSYGTLASANVYRFSSKEWLANPGLSYYGYRWYDPNLQRWPNRNPIQEHGGINLYAVAANSPMANTESFGQAPSGLRGPWSMVFYGIFGYPRTVMPISNQLTEQAKAKAHLLEDTLMLALKRLLKCGQSGTLPVSHNDKWFNFDAAPVGPKNMGNWQLDLSGTCNWTCEKAQGPDCCCKCTANCSFEGSLSKTWTFQPWGFNTDNKPFWPVWVASHLVQQQLYQRSAGMYSLSAHFSDCRSMDYARVCSK